MSSIDKIKQEIANKYGWSNVKISGYIPVIEATLTCLAESDDEKFLVNCLQETIDRYEKLRDEQTERAKKLEKSERDLRYLKIELDNKICHLHKREERLSLALSLLEDDETPEGRDRKRAAQLFVNETRDLIETPQNVSMYINALGKILSGSQTDPESITNKEE